MDQLFVRNVEENSVALEAIAIDALERLRPFALLEKEKLRVDLAVRADYQPAPRRIGNLRRKGSSVPKPVGSHRSRNRPAHLLVQRLLLVPDYLIAKILFQLSQTKVFLPFFDLLFAPILLKYLQFHSSPRQDLVVLFVP